MRINLTGDGPAATALRGYLGAHGIELTDRNPEWTIRIEDGAGGTSIEGPGGELDLAMLRHLRKQITGDVETGLPVSGRREIRVRVRAVEADQRAVEIGVFRGLLEINSKPRWWQRKSK